MLLLTCESTCNACGVALSGELNNTIQHGKKKWNFKATEPPRSSDTNEYMYMVNIDPFIRGMTTIYERVKQTETYPYYKGK